MNEPNNAQMIDRCTRRLRAIENHVPKDAIVMIDGKRHTLADVIAIYKNGLDTRTTVATKRAELAAAIAARAHAETVQNAADRAMRPWVANQFGIHSQEAHDFGFPPPRAPAMSVEAKKNAVLLARATREARHTMGRKQKEKIRGTIATTAIVPATIDSSRTPP